jgi:hypothetical protein
VDIIYGAQVDEPRPRRAAGVLVKPMAVRERARDSMMVSSPANVDPAALNPRPTARGTVSQTSRLEWLVTLGCVSVCIGQQEETTNEWRA